MKTTFVLDAADVRALRSWAGRRVVSAAAVVRALLAELTERDPTRVAERLDDAPAPARPVKTTYDVPPDLYGDVRAWVGARDTTAASALRLLLADLLAGHPDLAHRVEERLRAAP